MAEEKFQYTLTLATRATGTGARDTASGMQQVSTATKQAEDASKRFLTAAEAEVAEVERLVAAAQKLAKTRGQDGGTKTATRDYEALTRAAADATDKVRINEIAHYDLDAGLRKTNQSSQTFTAGQTEVAKSSRNSAQALLLFSQGFEDAQYGIRGVLNNIPGLIFAMGGGAGLAGAISIASVALAQLIPLLFKAKTNSKEMAAALEETKANATALEEIRLDGAAAEIDNLRARTDALEQTWDDTRAAENQFTTTALDNSGKLAEAQRMLNEALGIQVDHYKELQNIAAQEAAARALAAEQAIVAEREKLAAQEAAVTKAADEFQAQRQLADIRRAELVQAAARLEALRAERAELEKINKYGSAPDKNRKFNPLDAIGQDDYTGFYNKKTLEAGAKLEDPAFKAKIQEAEGRLSALESSVLALTKDGGIVTRAENAFLKARTQLEDVEREVEIKTQSIQDSLKNSNIAANVSLISNLQEQNTTDLSNALTKVQTTTEAGSTALNTLKTLAADGKITADESDQLARSSVQLIGQIQAGLATAGTNTAEILSLLVSISTREQQTRREIQEVKRAIADLQR